VENLRKVYRHEEQVDDGQERPYRVEEHEVGCTPVAPWGDDYGRVSCWRSRGMGYVAENVRYAVKPSSMIRKTPVTACRIGTKRSIFAPPVANVDVDMELVLDRDPRTDQLADIRT
jgi:hypothetical protein